MKLEVVQLEAKPVVGMRIEVKQDEIGNRIGELLPRVMQAAGEEAAGPPLARWHGWEEDRGTMELAVPVRNVVKAAEPLASDALPAGKAVVVWHVGSYDNLHHTWTSLRRAMAEQGFEGRGAPWEEYVTDCSQGSPDDARTRIVWPVR